MEEKITIWYSITYPKKLAPLKMFSYLPRTLHIESKVIPRIGEKLGVYSLIAMHIDENNPEYYDGFLDDVSHSIYEPFIIKDIIYFYNSTGIKVKIDLYPDFSV